MVRFDPVWRTGFLREEGSESLIPSCSLKLHAFHLEMDWSPEGWTHSSATLSRVLFLLLFLPQECQTELAPLLLLPSSLVVLCCSSMSPDVPPPEHNGETLSYDDVSSSLPAERSRSSFLPLHQLITVAEQLKSFYSERELQMCTNILDLFAAENILLKNSIWSFLSDYFLSL